MAYIKFNNASIDIPVFNANSRSLKNKIIRVASIGKLGNDTSGHIIVKALKNLNFELKNGDKLGLIGSNGAGKSTLLRAISGVYPPTKGKVMIQGNVASLIDISLGIDHEAVAGPGLGTIILNYKFKSSSVRERALYLNEQLQLPEDERILIIKELDEGQVMHKPGKL